MKYLATFALVLGLVAPTSASAAPTIEPVVFAQEGTTLVAEGNLVGIDPTLPYYTFFTATALIQTGCGAPEDGEVRLGKDVWQSQGGRSNYLPAGTTAFEFYTYPIKVPTEAQAGCSSVSILSVNWERAVVWVYQGSTEVAEQGFDI